MNLSKKGWLKDYLLLKESEYRNGITLDLINRGHHPDETLYSLIQPTGIMYGFPLKDLHKEQAENQESRVKLLLMDTLMSSYFLLEKNRSNADLGFDHISTSAVNHIGQFYNSVYDNLYTSGTTIFGQKRTPDDIVEKILDKRIKKTTNVNFWSGFFHNSLLFLDIYFFRQWVQASHEKAVSEFIKIQIDELRLTVVRVMAGAAHANKVVEKEEQKMFQYFIDSLPASQAIKKTASEYFEKGINVDEIDMPQDDSWILKKYLLELAILIAWADRKVQDEEYDFLLNLNIKMGFSADDFENSMIAVEGFVLDYWEEIDKLQGKQDFETISNRYKDRLEKIIIRYQDILYKEVQNRKELATLLHDAKSRELSDKENEFIREGLIEVLESLPAFEIISLPRRFLSLQVLMRILPSDFFKKI